LKEKRILSHFLDEETTWFPTLFWHIEPQPVISA